MAIQTATAPTGSDAGVATPMRVLIADDHALVRAGLRALLDRLEGVEVVGEATDGREAVQLAADTAPDVVLMDISMTALNGIEATAQITAARPATRVLMLSMHASPEYAQRALKAGATGYVVKDANLSELADALHAVSRGESYLSPAVAARDVMAYRPPRGRENGDPLSRLTPRQREILQLIAEGVATRDIATQLGLSIKTVETHRAQVMERLEIHNVPGLVRFAIRVGLVSSDR